MITIYSLKTTELFQKHFESISVLIGSSPHVSVFNGLNSDDLNKKLSALVENKGLILKASYDEAAAGVLIAEIRNAQEFGVLELWVDPDGEDRIVDLLFEQCQQEAERRNYNAIYCNHDWFGSVQNKLITSKFIMHG